MKRIFIKKASALLTAAVLAVSSAVCAYAADSLITLDGLSFEFNSDGEAVIRQYDDRSAELTIPKQLLGANVAEIGDYAFYDDRSIRSVTFAEGLTLKRMGIEAFRGCTGITSVSTNVENLDFGAFSGCTGLRSASVNTSAIPAQCFYNCRSLSEISLSEGLTSIDDYAFTNCFALKELTIPAGVSYISDKAFLGAGDILLRCKRSSYALSYAKSNRIRYDVVDPALGDANIDGDVNVLDVTFIQKALVNKSVLSSSGELYADINADGAVNIRDATLIQLYLARYDVPYAIGE